MHGSDHDDTAFDVPEINRMLFHPRPEWRMPAVPQGSEAHLIPVAPDVVIGARFFLDAKTSPAILFFHGNGEIAADYEEIGVLFRQSGLNLMVADYRGYGQSTGRPTMGTVLRDAHAVLHYVRDWLAAEGFTGPLLVMGRSLGSAPALELASHYDRWLDGLIIESGFAYISPLLRLIGVDPARYGLSEARGPGNLDKVRRWKKPLLVIHAEFDQIIAYAEGLALFEASPATDKRMLKIANATHNDIFFQGMNVYLEAVRELALKAAAPRTP